MGFYKQQAILYAVLSVVSGLASVVGHHHGVTVMFFGGFVVASIAFIMSAVSMGRHDAEKLNAR